MQLRYMLKDKELVRTLFVINKKKLKDKRKAKEREEDTKHGVLETKEYDWFGRTI